MAFKDRLKEAREQAGLNQTELAELLGNVTNKTISSYENGNSFPKTDILYKIFDVLHTTPNFLFQDVVNIQKKTKEELTISECEMLKKYRKLDIYGKEVIDNILTIEYERCKVFEEYITEVAARGDSKKKVNIRKDTIRKDLENYTPPDEL